VGSVNGLTCEDAAPRTSPVLGIHIVPRSADNKDEPPSMRARKER